MSRGLGKTQKRVLRLLGTRKWKSLKDLYDKLWWRYPDASYGHESHWPGTAYMSIYRAVKTLEKRGLVETKTRCKFMVTVTGQHTARILVARKTKR
jgi:Fe2+ or Zn2+ uptake regulation protein